MEANKMLIAKYGNGTLGQVKEFEKKYNISFDEKYRDFLIKYNGGDTPNTIIKQGRKSETVRYLYGLNTEETIERNLEYFDWKEKKCIPIGEDNFGNYYTIGVSEENNGIIYFCDHEKGFAKRKIADSFKEFINKCKSELIDDFARSSPEEIEKIMIGKGRGHIITNNLRDTWRKQYEKYKDMLQEEVIL